MSRHAARRWARLLDASRTMTSPVRCLHCRTVYDMGAVQIVDRHFIDATTWRCPGCRQLVDDRSLGGGIGPVGRRDVERVSHNELRFGPHPDIYGHREPNRVIWPPASGHYPI